MAGKFRWCYCAITLLTVPLLASSIGLQSLHLQSLHVKLASPSHRMKQCVSQKRVPVTGEEAVVSHKMCTLTRVALGHEVRLQVARNLGGLGTVAQATRKRGKLSTGNTQHV